MPQDRYGNNSIGRKLQESFCSFCDEASVVFSSFSFLKELENDLQELRRSAIRPFNIAVFGRMKTGKSTLINALLGKRLAITDVEEATATINVIAHTNDSSKLNHFIAHWKDAPAELLPLSQLQEKWTGKTPEVLERIRQTSFIELFSDLDSLKLCEITDTPGTGSEVVDHEKITQAFLEATSKQGRKSDAIIYVFSPIGRESDLENLEKFKMNNCLPNSDPYNSVAVLHKWDLIFWENDGDMDDINRKATRLMQTMKAVVADVIPVSAPLALAASEAPSSFFSELVSLCRELKWEDLKNALRTDLRWNKDSRRHNIILLYSMPWTSFQVIVREISRNQELWDSEELLRKHLYDLSGIQRLKSFLDMHFFKHSEIIRQKQKLAEIFRIKSNAYTLISDRLESLSNDIEHWEELYQLISLNPRLEAWLSRKRSECIDEYERLNRNFEYLDNIFINSSIPDLIQDEETAKWCAEQSQNDHPLLSAEQHDLICKLFDYFIGIPKCLNLEKIQELNKYVAKLANYPSQITRRKANHIKNRIGEYLKSISLPSDNP